MHRHPIRRLVQRPHRALPVLAVLLVAWSIASPAARAQPTFEFTQQLDFDEPEAWAMKFFTAACLPSLVGPVEERERGRIDLGFELLQIPHLDREQRTVGFGGFKEEDLNRSPVWGRLRLDVGLGGGFTLGVGWVPPVEGDGVEANLVSLGLSRPIIQGQRWSLGLHLRGQVGEAQGDFTCAAGGDERFAPGTPENPFGCEAPSNDEVTMDSWGADLVWSLRARGPRAPSWHVAAGWSRLDLSFQVDALTFGFRDRSRLETEGEIVHFAAGASWRLGERLGLATELFWAPLDIQRVGQISTEDDPLVHLRVLGRWRLR